MKIILKERIESAKFGVVFPEGIKLDAFEDVQKRFFVQHPLHKNVYTRVTKKEIKKLLTHE